MDWRVCKLEGSEGMIGVCKISGELLEELVAEGEGFGDMRNVDRGGDGGESSGAGMGDRGSSRG